MLFLDNCREADIILLIQQSNWAKFSFPSNFYIYQMARGVFCVCEMVIFLLKFHSHLNDKNYLTIIYKYVGFYSSKERKPKKTLFMHLFL